MIGLGRQWLFVHLPKTGGNSVTKALLPHSENFIHRLEPAQDLVDTFALGHHDLGIGKHASLREYVKVLGHNQVSRMFVFSVSRNPYERIVSHYFSRHRGSEIAWDPDLFEDFALRVPTLEYFLSMPGPLGRVRGFRLINRILSFHNLEEEFADLCPLLLGAGEIPALEHVNKSLSSRPFGGHRDYFSTRLRNKIEQLHRLELRQFGYKF